jgi:serine/threonine protein kinase
VWNTELHITVNKTFFNFRNEFSFFREIASRSPHSFATDVWSLGILIVTLLTGRPPFDTDSMLYFSFELIDICLFC